MSCSPLEGSIFQHDDWNWLLTHDLIPDTMTFMDFDTPLWKTDRVLKAFLMLYLLAQCYPQVTAVRSTFLVLIVVTIIIKMILSHGIPFRRTPLDIPILIYSLIVLYKTVYSIDRIYSFHVFTSEFLRYIFIYYVLTGTMTRAKDIYRLLTLLIIGMTSAIIVGNIGYLFGHMIKNGRATSYFGNFGRAAFFVTLVFPILLGRFMNNKRRSVSILLGILIVLYIIFIILTMSRGAWLSTLAVTCLLSAIKDRRMLIVLLISLILMLWILPTTYINRAISIAQIFDFNGKVSFGDRLWLWQSALDMIRVRPFLGAGYGNRIFQKLYPQYIYPESSGIVFENAHNLYLQIAVECGLVGLCVFLLLILTLFILIIKGFRKSASSDTEGQFLGLAGSFTAFLLFSTTTFRYENRIGMIFWFLIAATVSLYMSLDRSGADHVTELP